jgi:hypothetical protein
MARGKVLFFGDSRRLYADEPVIVAEKDSHIAVCDLTECGAYIASKLHAWGYALEKIPLEEALSELSDDAEVEAWNNGVAQWFREAGIRTIGDLKRACGAP